MPRRAFEHGWKAVCPVASCGALVEAQTNDVQKAIWEKVQAKKERGPARPITIPPPKKPKSEVSEV